jgi:hypothetical protein
MQDPSLALHKKRLVSVDMQKAVSMGDKVWRSEERPDLQALNQFRPRHTYRSSLSQLLLLFGITSQYLHKLKSISYSVLCSFCPKCRNALLLVPNPLGLGLPIHLLNLIARSSIGCYR